VAADRKKFTPPPLKAENFKGTNGYDLMAGRTLSTKPAPKRVEFVPQLGLNTGFDRRP
jgi:hypothetical protein